MVHFVGIKSKIKHVQLSNSKIDHVKSIIIDQHKNTHHKNINAHISLSNFHPILVESKQYYQEIYTKESKNFEVFEKHRYLISPPNYGESLSGEIRLRQFENILNSFAYERHVFQREFHDIITKALAELIVGEDWNIIGPRLMQKRSWKKRSKCAMAMAPRRFGKSVSIAMIVVAFAIVKKGSTQSIFSTGRRASSNLLEICKKFAIEVGAVIERDNMEELWIVHDDKSISKIFSYPANAKVFIFFSFYLENKKFVDWCLDDDDDRLNKWLIFPGFDCICV
jgi:hypothetical protein